MIQRSLSKMTQVGEVSNKIVNRGFAPSTKGSKELMRDLYNREVVDNPVDKNGIMGEETQGRHGWVLS